MKARDVVLEAEKWLNTKTGSVRHKDLVDYYNGIHKPLTSYKLKYNDSWCMAFISVIFNHAGAGVDFTYECGCERAWRAMQSDSNFYCRNTAIGAMPGDIVFFGPMTWRSHVGVVTSVDGEKIYTIEGNANAAVRRRSYYKSKITSLARYDFQIDLVGKSDEEVAREVISGLWGNNPYRRERLEEEGYNYTVIQKIVNQLLKTNDSVEVEDFDVVIAVIRGDFGNGSGRREKLLAAGYDPDVIQERVNDYLKRGGK